MTWLWTRYPNLAPSPKLSVFVCEILSESRKMPASIRDWAKHADEMNKRKTVSLNIRPKYDEAASIRVAGGITGVRNGNARIASQEVSCKSGTLPSYAYYFAVFSDAAMALAPAASSLL